MNIKRIFDGIADTADHFNLLNRYQAGNPYADKGFRAGQFWQIGEAEYWHFLNLLPPMAYSAGSFAMSEFSRENLTESYHLIGDCYYCMTIEYLGPESVKQARAAIANATAADK